MGLWSCVVAYSADLSEGRLLVGVDCRILGQ